MNGAVRRHLSVVALALGATAFAGGCALAPFRSGPAGPEAPAEPARESPDAPAEGSPAASAPVPESGASDSTAVAGDVATEPPPDRSLDTPPPPAPDPDATDQVQVRISDTERAELEARARESLREARQVIRTIDRATLSAESLEKLTTAESLVESARAAFDTDIRAAATLAHKASVLLAELTTN